MTMSVPTQSRTGDRFSPEQFEHFREIVRDRTGIRIPADRRHTICTRLARRLDQLEIDDAGHYLTFITSGPYQQDELERVLHTAVREPTVFPAEDPQLDAFERQVLPELIRSRADDRCLRIWSAVCSSGEEPCSIATRVLKALGNDAASWSLDILGTDPSEHRLRTARAGRYPAHALDRAPAQFRDRWFVPSRNVFDIDPAVRAITGFEQLDIRDELAVRRFGTWDLIVCRDLLPTFDDRTRTAVARSLLDQLAPGGALLLGACGPDLSHEPGAVREPGIPGICLRRPSPHA